MNSFNSAKGQRGIATIEFALVATLFFFTMLIGIMEVSRLMFYWNTATEATRWGARIAVVCSIDDASIKTKMTSLFSLITPEDIQVAYEPAGCSVTTCQQVTVRIATTVPIQTAIPFLPLSVTLPSFSTTLPRESMKSSIGSDANPVCG